MHTQDFISILKPSSSQYSILKPILMFDIQSTVFSNLRCFTVWNNPVANFLSDSLTWIFKIGKYYI